MIPIEMADRVVPRASQLAVRRLEKVLHAGMVIIPDSVRQRTRFAAAVIQAVDRRVTESQPLLVPGAIVLLAAGAGRDVRFGSRDEVVVTLVPMEAILLVLDAPPDDRATVTKSPLSGVTPAMLETFRDGVERRHDEGDPHGAR